jgi:hypothetical protein
VLRYQQYSDYHLKKYKDINVNTLDQVVIDQHNLARQVEEALGQCKLSIEMRRIADTLSALNNPIKQSTAKGDQ